MFTTSASGLIAVWPREAIEGVRSILEKQSEELPLKDLVDLVQARRPAPS